MIPPRVHSPRRLPSFFAWAAMLLPLATLLAPANRARAVDEGAFGPPNLILLLTDDQAAHALGVVNPLLQTPHLDTLAGDGVRFSHAFATAPICPSSRATILTGLHESSHRFSRLTPTLPLDLLSQSYPVLLRQAGYLTGFVGKNGARLDETRQTLLFDSFVEIFRDPYLKPQPEGGLIHATDLIAAEATHFIQQQLPGQPFALIVWFNAPHSDPNYPEQFIPPQRFADLYDEVSFPSRPLSDSAFFDALPAFLRNGWHHHRWSQWWTQDLYQTMARRYYAMLSGVDDAVGAIRQALVSQELDGNTVILFSSDNGFYLGERQFGGKNLAHEPSVRVPLVLFDPRLDASLQGRVVDQLVANVDFPSTFLDLAGLPVPPSMQGRSLVPLLTGTATSWREDLFLQHDYFLREGQWEIPRHYSLRSQRFKYIEYPNHPEYRELYDLDTDPAEAINLAENPAFAAQRALLAQRLLDLRQLYGPIFANGFEEGDASAWQ